MNKTIVSKEFLTAEETGTFITTLRGNGWNLMSSFIQIVPNLNRYIVFYEKYLEEPMRRGVNL